VPRAMAFAPLAFGLYWKRANNTGALASIAAGGLVWLALLLPSIGWLPAPGWWLAAARAVPPQFTGLLAAVAAMIAGSLLARGRGRR